MKHSDIDDLVTLLLLLPILGAATLFAVYFLTMGL